MHWTPTPSLCPRKNPAAPHPTAARDAHAVRRLSRTSSQPPTSSVVSLLNDPAWTQQFRELMPRFMREERCVNLDLSHVDLDFYIHGPVT
jgi:hypothetical protein